MVDVGDSLVDVGVDTGTQLVDATNIDERLGQARHHRAEFLERLAGSGHSGSHVQAGEDAVAGGGELTHDDVAGLLPAE